MFCSKCGKQIDDEAMFCPSCGCATKNMVVGDQTAFSQKSSDIAVQKTGVSAVNNRKSKKIILIIGIVLAVLLILAAVIFLLQKPKSTDSYPLANSYAKVVHTNAYTYCVQCELNDLPVKAGVYKIDLNKSASLYLKNGKDLEKALQNCMGESNGGYALVEVGSWITPVKNVYWCREDCFGSDYSAFDISKVNNKKYVVGSYPDENYPQ